MKHFRPRRGRASILSQRNPILYKGEIIFECPDTGVGKGTVKMKMGDGTTPYNSLPYAIRDTIVEEVAVKVEPPSGCTTVAQYMGYIVSDKKVKTILGAIKKVLELTNTTVSSLSSTVSDLNTKMASFESAKSTIISSALGKALSMTSSTTIAQVASKISGVANKGAWTSTITTADGQVTIPAGYHNGSGYVKVSGLYVAPTTLSDTLWIGPMDASSTITKTVTFSTPFSSVPTVTASNTGYLDGNSATPISLPMTISNITKAGFTVAVTNNNGEHGGKLCTDVKVYWNAVV